MKAPSLTSRLFMALGATIMLALSATLAWAVVSDYQGRGVVPAGVSIAGEDLGNMSEDQAREAIESIVSAPMMREVTVTGDGKTWTIDPDGMVSVDVDGMLAAAYSTRRAATLAARLDSQFRGTPLTYEIKPKYAVDKTALASWVAERATEVDRKPINAKREIVGYKFKITPETYGAQVDQPASVEQIAEALSADAALSTASRETSLAVASLKPKVVASKFKTAIIVSLAQCKVRLYKGDKLVKTYLCAPGRPGFPTPTGDFKIVSKQRYAPWINPGTAWAKDMPAIIPGGPNNPMGTTKIGIDYSGVFFHGVPPSEYGSIGTHASHGCMRMLPSTVLDLYGRVKIGNPVFIRP